VGLIRELAIEGTTILLTTQYLEEADRLADQIAVIDGGLVIAEGTSDELKTKVGGEVLQIRAVDRSRTPEAAGLVLGLGPGGGKADNSTGEITRLSAPRRRRCSPRRSVAWTGPRSSSRTSGSTGRRWTTCSSR
jgi:ABC-type multidrug transport system ATPase subunit